MKNNGAIQKILSLNIVKTALLLIAAALIGVMLFGGVVFDNAGAATVAVLIVGQALIIEAVRDLKR